MIRSHDSVSPTPGWAHFNASGFACDLLAVDDSSRVEQGQLALRIRYPVAQSFRFDEADPRPPMLRQAEKLSLVARRQVGGERCELFAEMLSHETVGPVMVPGSGDHVVATVLVQFALRGGDRLDAGGPNVAHVLTALGHGHEGGPEGEGASASGRVESTEKPDPDPEDSQESAGLTADGAERLAAAEKIRDRGAAAFAAGDPATPPEDVEGEEARTLWLEGYAAAADERTALVKEAGANAFAAGQADTPPAELEPVEAAIWLEGYGSPAPEGELVVGPLLGVLDGNEYASGKLGALAVVVSRPEGQPPEEWAPIPGEQAAEVTAAIAALPATAEGAAADDAHKGEQAADGTPSGT